MDAPLHTPILDAALFESFAQSLNVKWPEWYRRLVLTLIDLGADVCWDFDFICMRPEDICYDTNMYRQGKWQLFPKVTENEKRSERKPIPWPQGHVIVGTGGSGGIVINTLEEDGVFLELHKEQHCFDVLYRLSDAGGSPEAVAQGFWDRHGRLPGRREAK